MKVLITGVTGFVGGLVAPALSSQGHDVLGVSRAPVASAAGVRVVRADVFTGEGLDAALQGVEVAYYLVHSLEHENPDGFETRDPQAAERFVRAAQRAGVRRIIHCGVLPAAEGRAESTHRRVRHEVERILMSGSSESVTMRVWTILAPENQFVRFLRDMICRLPVVTLPPSRKLPFRPIDGRDLGSALAAAASSEELAGRVVELGGPDVMTTEELCRQLAQAMNVRAKIVGSPFAIPRWMQRKLAESLGYDPEFVLPVLESAEAGVAIGSSEWLRRLVPKPFTAADSLRHCVETWRHAA